MTETFDEYVNSYSPSPPESIFLDRAKSYTFNVIVVPAAFHSDLKDVGMSFIVSNSTLRELTLNRHNDYAMNQVKYEVNLYICVNFTLK